MKRNDRDQTENRVSDAQWDAIARLIPLLGREKEWEVSSYRHKRCLWEREEDAPFTLPEAMQNLRAAMKKPLTQYPLSSEDLALLVPLFEAYDADPDAFV